MATTDQNITELPIKTASEVSDADYLMGIDLVEGYQVLTKDFADYVVNEAEITVGGKKQTTADAISEIGTTASNAQPKESGKGLSTNDYTTAEKNKLSGIATGAEVNVNADWNATNGDAQILNKPTTVEGYGITDAYTKTEVDEITDTSESESADSNPITIVTDSAQIAKNTHLTFEPIQDLHGYDHPWPAGGGKNLLEVTATSQTVNGVTFTVNEDGTVLINGTSTAGINKVLHSNLQLPSNTYVLSTGTSLPEGSVLAVTTSGGDKSTRSTSNEFTAAITGDVWFFAQANITFNNVMLKPMIRLATESDATFEPYSNICPISGLDEVEVKRTGKNLVPFDESYEVVADSTWVNLNCFLKTGTYVFTYNPSITTGAITFNCYDKDGENIFNYPGINNRDHRLTFTIEKDCYRISSYSNSSLTMSELMIRLASDTDDTYEPYQGQIAETPLTTTVYGGTLDLETGELVVDRALKAVNDYFWYGSNGTFYTDTVINKIVHGDGRYDHCISDVYASKNVAKTNQLANGEMSVNPSGYIQLKDLRYSTTTDFKANMGATQIVYELATPITYTLTPKQLSLLKGMNHISTNAKSVKVTFKAGQLATLEDVAGAVKIADEHLEEKITDLLTILAPIENGTTASKAYTTGEYFMHNGQFCKAKTAIASGATFTLNTNYEVTTVGAELYTALHS